MAKPTKKQLTLRYKVDLKTFHTIRRTQKSLVKMDKRIQSYRKRLRSIYKNLIETLDGNAKVEVVR